MTAPAPFSAQWTPTSAASDLERWSAFLAAQGLAWTPTDKDREFVAQVVKTGSAEAPRIIELRLSALAHDHLARSGDARRLAKDAAGGWHLLSAEQRAAMVAQGHSFENPPSALTSLLTIPVTVGAYVGATAACEALGLPREVSWVVALAAYTVTHRLVRGRWPLQRRG